MMNAPSKQIAAIVALGVALAAPLVQAGPCAGFVDVDDSSPFCPNVEWIKNRSITLGCTATEYCPASVVSRLSMAAFMNRLGVAVLPEIVNREQVFNSPLDLSNPVYLCQTVSREIQGYVRKARIDASLEFAGATQSGAGYAVDPVASLDGGATWFYTRATSHRLAVTDGTATGTVISNDFELVPGANVAFALLVYRAPGTTPNPTSASCTLRGTIQSAP
jgi:hypothetical protein